MTIYTNHTKMKRRPVYIGAKTPGQLAEDESSEIETPPPPFPSLRTKLLLLLFVLVTSGIYFYWLAFPLINTQFTDGYPHLVFPEPLAYRTGRYGWDWVAIWMLSLNLLLPMTFLWGLANRGEHTYGRMFAFFASVAMILNLVIFIILTVRWVGWCNYGHAGEASACNDYRYCCVFFPSPWCPNGGKCGYDVDPNIDSGGISHNNEHLQHWAFSLVFMFMAYMYKLLFTEIESEGVFQ